MVLATPQRKTGSDRLFAHLHTHSYYSFHSGTIPALELPRLAKAKGIEAMALTDTNSVAGVIEFYKACKEHGVKPILGVELKTTRDRAVLLAKNWRGYREICEVLTRMLDEMPQIKPKLTVEDYLDGKRSKELPNEKRDDKRDEIDAKLAPYLEKLSENIIILTSTPRMLYHLGERKKRDLYIELIPSEYEQWKVLREIYRGYKLPVVVTNNVHFAQPQAHFLHTLLRAIGTNTTMTTLPDTEIADPTNYLTSEEEFKLLAPRVDEQAFKNIKKIVDECSIDLELNQPKWAKFPGKDPDRMLKELASQKFNDLFPNPNREYISRFEQEITTIALLRSSSYFLAVHDMIEFARHKNFPYLGRGSGANSFIAFLLGIANVDPVKNNLRFERFLNPARKMPPDFDIDFSWKDRYEVIHYMLNKYGTEKAAMLSTIQRYRYRGAIREVGKAFGYPDAEIRELSYKMNVSHHTAGNKQPSENIWSTLKQSPEDIQEWMRYASMLQRYPRHFAVHAGGLVIADKNLNWYTATQSAPIGVPITQQDMFTAEDWGLIKLDILATRGLGTYWDTMKLVEQKTGVRPPVEDPRVAFNDEATKELIRTGKTKGCFYIESPAMISLLRKLKTDTFENLTAASSVIRPGVSYSGMMDEFIRRHHDPSSAKHIHPMIGELMKETYGVMVYQEDVLSVVHEFAGLSYAEADLFRRAMSGKLRSHEFMSKQQDTFVKACIDNGIEPRIAEEVWRQVSTFSGYSFCKAHSASYAVLSFQEAWLKQYHPTEFLCSVLNNQGGFYHHQEYINEAKLLGIEVRLPDINKSEYEHTVQDGAIQLGFLSFKSLKRETIDRLTMERNANGPYVSLRDLIMRSGIAHEEGSMLIMLGACDKMGVDRARGSLEFSILYNNLKRTSRPSKKMASVMQVFMPLPDEKLDLDLSHLSDYTALQRFRLEREHFGYSVTHQPIDFLHNIREGTVLSKDVAKYDGREIDVVGHIAACKITQTRKGAPMAMLNLGDEYGMLDVVIWPNEFKDVYANIITCEALRIRGRVQLNFGVPAISARRVEKLAFQE